MILKPVFSGKPVPMTHNRTQLHRLLLLEAFLAVGGILLVSGLYLHAVGQQQRITEDLFEHPFTVSNAGMEFRADVLELRKYMLETILSGKQVGDAQLRRIRGFQDHMDSQLVIIRREFLGDQARVSDIIREVDAWEKVREPIEDRLLAGIPGEALNIALLQAPRHIEQILEDTDYVISFARARGLRFVEEGRAEMIQARQLLALLGLLTLVGYLLLARQLRKGIYQVYGREEHDATFDELSGAHSRRSLIRTGEVEVKRARRHGYPLSLLMMDLDHFKNVNDAHGHGAGDFVLSQFGVICNQYLREEDLFGRIGGEEFAILLPHTDLVGAFDVADRIRQAVAGRDFKIAEGKSLQVTVSIGVAILDDDIDTIDILLKRADEALYRSKSEGRNRVTAGPPVQRRATESAG